MTVNEVLSSFEEFRKRRIELVNEMNQRLEESKFECDLSLVDNQTYYNVICGFYGECEHAISSLHKSTDTELYIHIERLVRLFYDYLRMAETIYRGYIDLYH